MSQRFKLTASVTAKLHQREKFEPFTIPANSLVTVVDGDPNGNGLVKVGFEDKVLSMFACDLRSHGVRVWGQSA